jgi:hypothetical protein
MARVNQFPGMLPVEGKPLGLSVGSKIAFLARSLVILNPCPAERFDEILHSPLNLAGLISVLDSEDKSPVVAPGKEIVIEGSPQSSDMEVSRGARGKADADRWRWHTVEFSQKEAVHRGQPHILGKIRRRTSNFKRIHEIGYDSYDFFAPFAIETNGLGNEGAINGAERLRLKSGE